MESYEQYMTFGDRIGWRDGKHWTNGNWTEEDKDWYKVERMGRDGRLPAYNITGVGGDLDRFMTLKYFLLLAETCKL